MKEFSVHDTLSFRMRRVRRLFIVMVGRAGLFVFLRWVADRLVAILEWKVKI